MTCEYTYGRQKVTLRVADDMLAVRFREPAPYSVRTAAVSRPEMESFDTRFEVPAEKFTVFKVAHAPQAPEQRLENAMSAMAAEAEVERTSPVFIVGDAYAIATDRLMVGFTTATGARKILKGRLFRSVE